MGHSFNAQRPWGNIIPKEGSWSSSCFLGKEIFLLRANIYQKMVRVEGTECEEQDIGLCI